MNTSEAIELISGNLSNRYEPNEAKTIARYYLEDTFDIKKAQELTSQQQDRLTQDLKLLNEGMPLQYVTGLAHFYGYVFNVSRGVLIPRAETEELVREVVAASKEYKVPITFLDVGTGSGCIAIAVKKQLNNTVKVTALDVDSNAILQTIENAFRLDAPVKCICTDIDNFDHNSNFDIIASNPPYIDHSEADRMDDSVKMYEPPLALYAPEGNPMYFYHIICKFATDHLSPNGTLLFEINAFRAGEVVEVARYYFPDATINLIQDMQGMDRIVSIKTTDQNHEN